MLYDIRTTALYIYGIKGHAGVIPGQPDYNMLENALWIPNLVSGTPEQRVMHAGFPWYNQSWGQLI